MKESSLKRIEDLIPALPEKDAILAKKFLKQRNFEYMLELVESDIYKANKNRSMDSRNIIDNKTVTLEELRNELITYMSYLDIPNYYDDYYFE